MSLTVDFTKRLGGFLLDVAFEAELSEVLALLGASGCGKSMTLKCIAGIEKPDKGRIILNGRTLFDSDRHINLAPQKRRVGYLFQQYALFPNMTVQQNIAAGVRGRSNYQHALFPNMTVQQNIAAGAKGRADRDRIVREKIDAMRLTGLENLRPHELSGGQQQRVALARILVNEPEALLLDEPFSALDSYLRWELELELAETLRGFEGPVVFVSHSREEVTRLCGSVCVLNNGLSEEKRGVKEVFSSPTTRSACLLSGCRNISAVSFAGGALYADDWGTPLSAGDRPLDGVDYIGVRSENLHIAEADGENTFPCTVLRVVEDHNSRVVLLSSPSHAGLTMQLGGDEGAELKSGDSLLIRIAPEDIMLLRK